MSPSIFLRIQSQCALPNDFARIQVAIASVSTCKPYIFLKSHCCLLSRPHFGALLFNERAELPIDAYSYFFFIGDEACSVRYVKNTE